MEGGLQSVGQQRNPAMVPMERQERRARSRVLRAIHDESEPRKRTWNVLYLRPSLCSGWRRRSLRFSAVSRFPSATWRTLTTRLGSSRVRSRILRFSSRRGRSGSSWNLRTIANDQRRGFRIHHSPFELRDAMHCERDENVQRSVPPRSSLVLRHQLYDFANAVSMKVTLIRAIIAASNIFMNFPPTCVA